MWRLSHRIHSLQQRLLPRQQLLRNLRPRRNLSELHARRPLRFPLSSRHQLRDLRPNLYLLPQLSNRIHSLELSMHQLRQPLPLLPNFQQRLCLHSLHSRLILLQRSLRGRKSLLRLIQLRWLLPYLQQRKYSSRTPLFGHQPLLHYQLQRTLHKLSRRLHSFEWYLCEHRQSQPILLCSEWFSLLQLHRWLLSL
jgi:hypothetical protein